MKSLFFTLSLIFSPIALAQDPYAFVTDFELVSVDMNGSEATFTVSHSEGHGVPARFEFIPGQVCAESYPAKCFGTVVRLDISPSVGEKVLTKFTVDFSDLFYEEGVIVRVNGPNGRVLSAQY